jgi:hypothetical protein
VLEDLEDVSRAEQLRTGLDHLLRDLVDDLAAHGMELLGGGVHGGVQPGQGVVHVIAVGQVAQARVLVVARVGEHGRPERVPVGGQRRTCVVVDGGGHRVGESGVGVGPDDGTHGRIRNHEVELRDGGLDEPADSRAAMTRAVLVALRHRGEHVREPPQPRQVALAPLAGVHLDLRQ